MQGAVEIFSRSENPYKVRFTQYLGDGDSKGFSAVQEMQPYGPDCVLQKLECIGHIQKRMGTRLRKLKAEIKKLVLSDEKGLGGKNRLSKAVIDQIQNYYGLAIRRTTDSEEKMRNDVRALFYHKQSTDENPHHELCPKGENSWCSFQKSVANKLPYSHKNSVPVPIMDFIKPVFKSLSDRSLLRKFLHGQTQNPNESVNSVIWARLPKIGFVGIKTLHLGVYDTVSTFNCGNVTKCMILQKLGITIGKNTIAIMKEVDKRRIVDSMRNSSEMKKSSTEKKAIKIKIKNWRTVKRILIIQAMELAYFKVILDLFH